MYCVKVVVFLLVCGVASGGNFPKGFKFGAATAAYQVEGAWNVSDKAPSVWDTLTHQKPEVVVDLSNGDVACNSYYNWKDDVELAAELGIHFYRFSISWPRLLPNGFANVISEDGKRFYNDLIDGLLEKGIEPVVTLYHWDLPQNLQDLGGWANPLIANWFEDYARVAFQLFGDRVRSWVTLNEPVVMCEVVYTMGTLAPRLHSPALGSYMCNKNVLLAHAAAWNLYDRQFRSSQNGKVSLTNHIFWMEPETEDDMEESELTMQYMVGMYSHAIYSKEGGWPPALEKLIAEKSKREGYPHSRLPAFTQEEIEFVRGTFDYYGVNHYTSRVARAARAGDAVGAWPMFGAGELGVYLGARDGWDRAANSWFYVNPPGLRKTLNWLKKNYGDIEFWILENGYSTYNRDIKDTKRIQYYRDYLEQVLLAIDEDGVNVTHYTSWTLLDNFEWNDGYTSKFGLVDVDFATPARTRTPRDSFRYYANVIARHSLDGADLINEI